MMKRLPGVLIVVAFTLLATMSIGVYAVIAYPVVTRDRFLAGLALMLLMEVSSVLIGRGLAQRVADLRGELAAEQQRKSRFEAHAREMYQELERKLEERTAELLRQRDILVRTEKLTALSRLVGGVAHELNNPLTAILGEAMILRERCHAPELSRGLRVIEQQATRCASLIRDLNAFASQEQRKVQPLDAQALLEGALAQVAMVASSQEVKVVRQYSQEPLVIVGNLEELQQALCNVIANAYQSMAGKGSGQLTLRSYRLEGWVRLQISDTGVGIDAETLPYIFDPFYSRRTGKMNIGMGLGLSVALGLIQAHGGRIRAESQVDSGTTIFIDLPECAPELAPHTDQVAEFSQ